MTPAATKKAPKGRTIRAEGIALGKSPYVDARPEGAGQILGEANKWPTVYLQDIGELSRGKSKHRPRNDAALYGGPHPFIQTGDIRESGGTITSHTQTYSDLGLLQSRLWPKGTLCITIAANIGETGILTYPACFPDSVVGFRYNGDSETVRFIELYFRIAKAELERMAPATAQKNINVEILSKLPIPWPPKSERHRIVAEIEKQLTRLDAGVAALRRAQANLKRYRAAVLKAACEGRLVPTEAELARNESRSFESGQQLLARILTERRQNWQGRGKYKDPEIPDIEALPKLPCGWTYATVEQLGSVGEQAVLTGPFGTNLTSADFTDAGILVLTISCLKDTGIRLEKADFVSEEKAVELDRYRLAPGDLLFSRMASVGRAGIVGESLKGALFNYHIMRLRLEPSVLIAKFYLAYVRGSAQVEKYLKEANHGATRAGINTDQLLHMPVVLPPLAEQARIVAEVERRLSVVEELEAVVTTNLQRATRLRQSILQKAFMGDL